MNESRTAQPFRIQVFTLILPLAVFFFLPQVVLSDWLCVCEWTKGRSFCLLIFLTVSFEKNYPICLCCDRMGIGLLLSFSFLFFFGEGSEGSR